MLSKCNNRYKKARESTNINNDLQSLLGKGTCDMGSIDDILNQYNSVIGLLIFVSVKQVSMFCQQRKTCTLCK